MIVKNVLIHKKGAKVFINNTVTHILLFNITLKGNLGERCKLPFPEA